MRAAMVVRRSSSLWAWDSAVVTRCAFSWSSQRPGSDASAERRSMLARSPEGSRTATIDARVVRSAAIWEGKSIWATDRAYGSRWRPYDSAETLDTVEFASHRSARHST
jgi:hypothetical protein